MALAASLLTITAGRDLLASDPMAGSRLSVTMSPLRISAADAVAGHMLPGPGIT